MTEAELYIHIPFCIRKCLYCDFLSGSYDRDIRKRYTKAVITELKYQSMRMSDNLIRSVYFGGGTPTFLEEEFFEKILKTVFKYYHVKEGAEITIECNPATASEETLKKYRSLGVNRISIGLQSANQKELNTLGRIHSFQECVNTFYYARHAGFTNINVDIMTGIPGQSVSTLKGTLDEVIKLNPEHISCYSLIIEEGTVFYEKYHEDELLREKGLPTKVLPSSDEEYDLYNTAREILISKGYGQYEISNYARFGKSCIHNIGYWQRVPYYGAGLGAASLIDEIRYKNPSEMDTYLKKIEDYNFPIYSEAEIVTKQAQIEEFMFLGLRMTEGISEKKFLENFEVPISEVYGDIIKELSESGLLEESEGFLRLTKRGMDVSNEVLSSFLF